MSGVQLVDLLFTGFDEGIDGGSIAAGHGSEDGSVNDPFVGFGGGGGVEGGKVFQRLFEFGFGLGGVAIFLCGRGVGSTDVLSVLSSGVCPSTGMGVVVGAVCVVTICGCCVGCAGCCGVGGGCGGWVCVGGVGGGVAGGAIAAGVTGAGGGATAAGAAPSAWVMASMAKRMKNFVEVRQGAGIRHERRVRGRGERMGGVRPVSVAGGRVLKLGLKGSEPTTKHRALRSGRRQIPLRGASC